MWQRRMELSSVGTMRLCFAVLCSGAGECGRGMVWGPGTPHKRGAGEKRRKGWCEGKWVRSCNAFPGDIPCWGRMLNWQFHGQPGSKLLGLLLGLGLACGGEGLGFPGFSLHQAGPQTSTLGSPAPAQPSAG